VEEAVAETGSTAVGSQVSREPGRPRKWLVMVFMGADDIPGDASLLKEAYDNIEQMKKILPKPDPHLEIFVQLHANGEVQRQRLGHDTELKTIDLSREASTNGNALTVFISNAVRDVTKEGFRPDDYSMLVMWGHTWEFGIGPQVLRNGIDALDFAELSEVLKRYQLEHKREYSDYYPGDKVPKLDIVAFDACNVATVEMACQLAPFTDYLLASQIGIPLPGWPYDEVLDRLKVPKGDHRMGPAELGSYIARRYSLHYAAENKRVTLSMLNLKRASQLNELTETLARSIAIAFDEDPAELDLIYELFLRSRTPDERPFIDVADFCFNLIRYSQNASVRAAAEALGNFLITPYPTAKPPKAEPPKKEERGSEFGVKRPFIVENVRNSADTAGLNGVSLYAPHVSDNDSALASHFYDKFVFAQKTLWSELVQGLMLPE
jgi:hypothetical protein